MQYVSRVKQRSIKLFFQLIHNSADECSLAQLALLMYNRKLNALQLLEH